MKKIAFALVVSAIFSSASQASVFEDLTTWSAAGPVSTSTNSASLNGTASISKSVSNIVSFDWSFKAGDYLPFNDIAYVTFDDVEITLSKVALVGNYGFSGWHTFNFATPFTGNLNFRVANVIDTNNDSTLNIQNVAVSAVPEPETYAMLLAGLGLMGSIARRRKQK